MSPCIQLPLMLTLLRLVVAPCCLPFLIITLSCPPTIAGNIFLALCFVFFGLTDFFDGYFARRFQQVTVLGAILDPLADKFLLYSALIGLLVIGKIHYCWVLLFIGREFFVMGLRHIALEHQSALPVSGAAKIKTALQSAYIALALLNPYATLGLSAAPYWNGGQTCLLAIALLCSLGSAAQYYYAVFTVYTTKGH